MNVDKTSGPFSTEDFTHLSQHPDNSDARFWYAGAKELRPIGEWRKTFAELQRPDLTSDSNNKWFLKNDGEETGQIHPEFGLFLFVY